MKGRSVAALAAMVMLLGCASNMVSQNGSFKGSFKPDIESRRDSWQIYSVGNEQGATAMATFMLVGIPVVVPSVQVKADITLDEAIQETCRVAYYQDCLAEAFRMGNEPAELRVRASVHLRDGLKKILKVEVIDDRQKLTPGDVTIYSNWREYSVDGSGLVITRENIPDDLVRDLLSGQTAAQHRFR